MGKCPACGEWSTFVEEVVRRTLLQAGGYPFFHGTKEHALTLKEINAEEELEST